MSSIIQIIWKYSQEKPGPQNNQFPLFVLIDDVDKKIFISLGKKNKTKSLTAILWLNKVYSLSLSKNKGYYSGYL